MDYVKVAHNIRPDADISDEARRIYERLEGLLKDRTNLRGHQYSGHRVTLMVGPDFKKMTESEERRWNAGKMPDEEFDRITGGVRHVPTEDWINHIGTYFDLSSAYQDPDFVLLVT